MTIVMKFVKTISGVALVAMCGTTAAAQTASAPTRHVGDAVIALRVISQTLSPSGEVTLMLRSGGTITVKVTDIDVDLSQRATETARQAPGGGGVPANQGDPRFYTRPTNPNLDPESSGFRYGGAPDYPTAPSAPASASGGVDGIRGRCASEWPRDFRMQQYCIEKQAEGLRSLANRAGMQSGSLAVIRVECARQWADDYRMRDYCETKQIEALRQLGR